MSEQLKTLLSDKRLPQPLTRETMDRLLLVPDSVRRVRTDVRSTEKYEGHFLNFIALLTSEKRTGKIIIYLNQGTAYNLEFEKVEKGQR